MFAIASKSGIIHNFEIYVGKGTVQLSDTGLGVSGDIVMRLTECIPKFENYKVAVDNWFNSYSLQCRTKYAGLQCIGTVRSNRTGNCDFETDNVMKKSGRGSYDWKVDSTNAIVCCKWFDNKYVHIISNYMGI